MSFLQVNALSAGYGKKNVIGEISFSLEKGMVLGILGTNGCGKTTLLKAIAGILPHQGECYLEDKQLESLSERNISLLCSYIPQRSGITIDISVLDVVLMGFNPKLGLLEHPNRAMREKAMQTLSLVGLSGKEQQNYQQLSEGQKQLCILARTLVSDSRLFLLDEPESALDFRIRFQILELIRRRLIAENKSALVTLHDPMLALQYCDALLLISDDGHKIGMIFPRKDSLALMEEKLCGIYGNVSLQCCITKDGKKRLVMLKEGME